MGLFDFITNPVGSIASSMIGGAASFFGTQSNNQAMQQMQQQQEAYNTQMSNTAYQRASADMKSAGLNPMMMFGSGSAASTPQAPSVQLQSPLQNAGTAMKDMVSSAVQVKTQDAVIDNLVQSNANLKTENLLKELETKTEAMKPGIMAIEAGKTRAGTDLLQSETKTQNAETDLRKAALPVALNKALTASNELGINSTARTFMDQSGFGGRKASEVVDPIATGVNSAVHARRFFTDRWPY